ncbi:MAG: HK97-gp10 family putative phage morphogenesis protein [Hyphomicrobiales bacterium]
MAKIMRIVRKKDRLRQKLAAVVPQIEAEIAKATAQGADEIAEMAKRLAPVAEVQSERRPGEYADSIHARRLRNDEVQTRRRNSVAGGTLAWGVFARWYWLWIEFGTKTGVTPRPHLLPAYRALRRRVTTRISRAMGKAIKKVANK